MSAEFFAETFQAKRVGGYIQIIERKKPVNQEYYNWPNYLTENLRRK